MPNDPNKQIELLLADYPVDAKSWRGWEPKGNGKFRAIAKPNKPLKKWLKRANKELGLIHPNWPTFMHGGLKKHSYVTHAMPHVNRPCVITIDVRECFDSISNKQVATCLAEELHIDSNLAKEIAKKLCFKGVVAQGFPTSNFVSNLYLKKPLTNIARGLDSKITITNYVDDIAVSGKIDNAAQIVNTIALHLSRSGLAINKKDKVRIMYSNERQVVCGLLVNKKLSVTKAKKLELFSRIATSTMSKESLDGWLANLHFIDPKLYRHLRSYAIKKNYDIEIKQV